MDHVYDFIANTDDGVFGVDDHQKIVLWNEAATSILGYSPREVLGKHCHGIIRGRGPDGCAVCQKGCDLIEAAAKLDSSPTQDLTVRTKRRGEIWINLSTVVVPSVRNKLSVLIHMFREVSGERELLRIVGEFAGVVSRISNSVRTVNTPKSREAETHVTLTPRESEILEQMMTGVSTGTIADRLCISRRTVRNHINNILTKLGVHTRLEAVTYSLRNGVV